MFLTAHAIFALIFAKFAPNVFWAFIIGIISHFFLDMVPHGEKEMESWSDHDKMKRMPVIGFFDIFVLLIISFFLFRYLNLPLANSLALMVGAILPDAIQAGLMAFSKNPFNNRYSLFHERVHKFILKKLISSKIGFVIQLISFGIFIYFLIRLYR